MISALFTVFFSDLDIGLYLKSPKALLMANFPPTLFKLIVPPESLILYSSLGDVGL